MKVKDLLNEIESCKEDYGEEFLEWEVYTEQISGYDKRFKSHTGEWETVKDCEGWEYFECAGFWTRFEEEKIFTVNVNY